jgi:hypothetical protein
MTAARRKQNRQPPRLATALVVAAALSALADLAVGLTQRIVIDWHSGLAIGGNDPLAATRGLAVAGNPNLWAVVGARLFVFFNAAQRQKFLADSARIIASS